MALTKTVVSRPTTIFIFFVLLVGFGLYSASDLAIDLYPEINPPVLLVFTNYEGAGPEEIEKALTRPMEGVLSNVSNLKKLTSTSSEGSSQIILEFTYGTNMDAAPNDVRDQLEFVKDFLPDEATSPMIFKFDPSMIPILNLLVSGNRPPEELREIADKIIVPRVEQVEGVSLAGVSGGRDRVIRVEIPQNRLEAYGLTLTQISGMLRGQNVQVAAGSITEGNKNYLIRTSGEYEDIQQIKNTVIAYKGAPASPLNPDSKVQEVLLRDVANIYDGFRKETDAVYINGDPGVYITIQKQSGTNSVQVAENVMSRLERVNKEVPIGTSVEVIQDTTKIVKASLKQVTSSAITGAVLAVIILFIFLRSFKSTIIIGISIPISLVITLMFMYFANLTLNIMTLTGLALGVGMLVDNSIVILENIYRYREKGAKLTASAILGSQEMINAIVASTLTTICVFAPVAVFQSQLETMGELFADLAFTVVISLASSLLVAIFLIPVLASRYFPISSRKQRPLRGPLQAVDNAMGAFFTGMDNLYKMMLRWVLKHRLITLLLIVGIFVFTLFLIPQAGFEFMPQMEEDQVSVNIEMPIGTKLDVTRSVLKQLELIVQEEVKGYKGIIVSAGQKSFFGFLGSSLSHKGSLTVLLPEFQKRIDTSEVVTQKLRSHFNDFPSAIFSFSSNQGDGGSANPIDILVKSNDLDKAKEISLRIRDLMKEKMPEITEPQMNLKEGLPQVEIFIDRDKAYSLGLNIHQIGQEVKANIDGITAGKFREGGSEYDILVILNEQDRDSLPDLNKIFVLNSMGNPIPLSSVAHLERTTGPVSISRENQTRTIHVTGGLAPGNNVNVVEPKLRAMIAAEVPADKDVVIEHSGEYADLMRYGTTLGIILIISICLVFGVMASQFESFLDPFIILFTIPLTLIGVILLYVLTGTKFSTFTAVGMVMLVGIVVNNGIVLVDYTNLLRKRGMTIFDACVEAGGNRLRPILMTSLTTILGLVPMAFFVGEGSDLVQPIGKTVVGGLSVATLLTLFLVPVIYSFFNTFSEKRKKRKEARRSKRMEKQQAIIEGLETEI